VPEALAEDPAHLLRQGRRAESQSASAEPQRQRLSLRAAPKLWAKIRRSVPVQPCNLCNLARPPVFKTVFSHFTTTPGALLDISEKLTWFRGVVLLFFHQYGLIFHKCG
jgi:hypothetical protein